MTTIENIKAYFEQKIDGNSTATNPKGVCPNCWGQTEWDGKFYEIRKDEHALPGNDIYDSFISEVANDHVLRSHNLQNKFICTNCNTEISE